MKKIFIIVFFILSLGSIENNFAQQYTLKEILKLTVENHPLIKQKEDELRAAQFRVDQQKSLFLPNVSAEASYTRIGPIPAFAFGGKNLELAPANNYNAEILVHHTLYDFGKRDAQVDYTASFMKSIKDGEDLIKNNLSNQAVRAFYGILFIEKSIAVKDTQYATLEAHLKITGLKIKNGTATDYDVLSTKARMIEIKNEKIELQNEMNKQGLFLKELIGMDRSKQLNVEGQLELTDYSLNSDSLLNLAYNQRQELQLAMDARNTANLQKEMIKQIDKPVVNLDLGYGFKNGYEPNIEVLRGNWFAGVSVGVPIFNGNLTENKINESNESIKASDKNIDQIKQSIATDIYQNMSDLKSSVEKINSTNEQIGYAEKSLERAKVQYERGAGTNLEVLDAETMLTQARLLNVQAVYKSIVSYYALRRAAGDKIFLY
jgi:outer membrane protein TolC